MLTLKQLAKELKEDRSLIRKWAIKQFGPGVFQKVRDPEGSGAEVLAFTKGFEHQVKAARCAWKGSRKVLATNGEVAEGGVFYAIQLAPEISESRMKFGFASSIENRCKSHRTCCPSLVVLCTWKCDLPVEYAALKVVASVSLPVCGSNEVYDVEDWGVLKAKLDSFFEILAT